MSRVGGRGAGTTGESASSRPPIVRQARATVRNWLPYVGLTAAFFLAVTILGAAAGHERRSDYIPIRAPGDPVLALEPLDLFLHNGQVAGLLIVGIIFVGLPTVALLGYNAFLFGATLADATASLGPIATLSILLPHGIFELPAIWLAAAITFRWLHVGWQTAQGGDRRVSVGRTVTESIGAILVIVLLLGIAAIIEGTVTKGLAEALT